MKVENTILIQDHIAYIPITNSSKQAIIDSKNIPKVSAHNTYFHLSGRDNDYAVCFSRLLGKKVALHTIVAEHKEVDHINTNKLDNREANLRHATPAQNLANRKKYNYKTSSQYKGVVWDKTKNLWQAQISFNRKNIFLGRFKEEQQAAKAYNKAAVKYYGEFARLNIITDQKL